MFAAYSLRHSRRALLHAMDSDPAAVPDPAASPVARPSMPIVPVLPTLPAVTSGSGGRGGAGSPLQVSTILTVLGSLLGVLVLLVLVQWASRRGVKLWRPSTWRAASNRGATAATPGTSLRRQSTKDALPPPPPLRVAPLLVLMPDKQVQCALEVEVEGAGPAPASADGEPAGQEVLQSTGAAGEAAALQVVELFELAPVEEPPPLPQQLAGQQLAAAHPRRAGGENLSSSAGGGSSCSSPTTVDAQLRKEQDEEQQHPGESWPASLSAAAHPAAERLLAPNAS